MRFLILSCNTGEGHNSCAKAIKEYCELSGDDCIIEDGLRFVSSSISHFILWGHTFVYRYLPSLFKKGYTLAENHPASLGEGSFVYRAAAKGADNLYEYITDIEYDAVICTHVFTSLMFTLVKRKYNIKIKSFFVATDFTCSPITKESALDYYFIPDSVLTEDFESTNIPSQKMIACGIPVRQMFYKSMEPAAAKRKENILPSHKNLLIMCGSMGCGPIKKLTEELALRLDGDCHITVVCGTNEGLRKRLEISFGNNFNVHIKGFVEDMSDLMDSADLYLTKSGGISVSEAAVKGLPMVLIDAVGGCEEYNQVYFTDKGVAVTGANTDELADICAELLVNDEKRLKMKQNFAGICRYNAAKEIYEVLKKTSETPYNI